MSIDSAVASNWVLEKFSATADGFNLLGTTRGYASFSRAFQDGTTVFYAASDDDGNREAGWGVYRGNKIVDRTPTATLTGTVYNDNNPSPLSFGKGGQIGGTFNALAFNTLWNRKGAGMVISATEPTDVETGMQWLDSTTAKVWIWDEDKWLEFPVTGSGGVGSTVQIEEWPPTAHKIGDTWVDYGTTGELYVWDGRFWVSMTGDGGPKVIIGDGEGGLPPDVELPENITFDQVESVEDFDQALARFIDPSNKGKWGRIKTSDILTNPDVTFRDAKGRFKSTKGYEGLTDQLKVNRFLAGEIESLSAEIDSIELPETDLSEYAKTEYVDSAVEAEKLERSLADIALRDGLQAEIDAIESYDDTAINEALAAEVAAREAEDKALQKQIEDEKAERSLADIGLRDSLQAEIDAIEIPEVDLTGYVSKDGDVMTGPLETPSIKTGVIEPEKWWGVDLIGALNVDNDDKPAVSIMKNGYSQMELSAVGSVSLWNGYTDFQPNDLVTKEYVDGQIDAIPETDLTGYVSKTGGDNMQGPLDVRNQPDTGSRDTSRVNTLGVYSNSSSSYLGLGTSGTKVYVGHNDTSFATPIKVAEIQEKNDGDGIAVTGQVTLGSEGTEAGHAVTKGYVDGRVDEVADVLPNDAPQPVDIGTQTIKITGSRPTGASGQAGVMQVWKAEAGIGGSPYNEAKFIVPDPSLIDLSISQMWLKQGNIVQRWETAGGGWFTNNNVLHISGTSTYGDDLIDGQPVELYYSDPTSAYLDVISKEESKADDRRLQAEIDQLALGLETLLTQRTHGKWVYVGFSGDNIPRNAGEFALASDDLSAQDNIITVNLTDLNGTTIGLSDVEVGDYIEIVDLDEPANYVLFTCTKAPEGTGISNIEVALKDKGNNFLVGDTCEIRFFAVNEENINLSELDDRYLKLSGGAMAANARINVDQIEPNDPLGYIRYEAGRDKRYPFALANCGMVQDVVAEEVANYFPIGDWSDSEFEPYPDLRAMDNSYSQLYEASQKAQQITDGAQNRRLDELEANSSNFVSKSGDEMTGQLIIRKPREVAIDIIGDGGNSQIKFWASGAVALQNYTAFKDNELVTKKYVDDAVSTTDAKAKGALLTHTQRLVHVKNGTDGSQFYFWDENNTPTDAMNNFRRFKWKLPNNHYLMGMEGAGENMGYLVIQNTGGSLLYQCQVSRAVKSSNSGYIDLYLNHSTHYGSSQLSFGGIFVVSMYSCLRESL